MHIADEKSMYRTTAAVKDIWHQAQGQEGREDLRQGGLLTTFLPALPGPAGLVRIHEVELGLLESLLHLSIQS